MPPRLARLRTHQRLLLGVVGEDLAQSTPDRGAHPVNRCGQVRVVGLDVLGPHPPQEVAVVCAVGTVADADVIEQRGPPDKIHLETHVGGGHPARGEIVDQRPHPGLAQVIDHRDDSGQHGEAIATLGQRDEPNLQIGQRRPQQITTGFRRGQPSAQPAQVAGEGLIGVLGVVDPTGHLGTPSGSGQLTPGNPLLLGDLQCRVQIGRRGAGAQQAACLTPQPHPRPETEPEPVSVAVRLAGGGAHHVGQRHVEHLGPEDLQRLAHLLHDFQSVAPVRWLLGVRQAGIAHRGPEPLPGGVQASTAKTAGDLERLRGLVRGGDARAIPRVVFMARRPRSQRSRLDEGLAQLGDPFAADALEGVAVKADPRGRWLGSRAQLAECHLRVESADAPGVSLVMQGRAVLHQTGTPVGQGSFDGCGVGVLGVTGPVQSCAELLGQTSLVGRPVVDVQDQVAQAETLQSPDHGVDGGTLLGHEQRPLALAGQGCDQVGDGLALAGPGRALDHQVGPAAHGVDDGLLG